MASSTCADTWMSRPCSSHVYQVTPTAGELRDLLAAQAGRAAAAARRQADLLGRDPLAAAAQERGQLLAADVRLGPRRVRRLPVARRTAARWNVGHGPSHAHAHRASQLPGSVDTRINTLWYHPGRGPLDVVTDGIDRRTAPGQVARPTPARRAVPAAPRRPRPR